MNGINLTIDGDYITIIAIIFGTLCIASAVINLIHQIKPTLDLLEVRARTRSWWTIAVIFSIATLNTAVAYAAIAFLSFVAFRELYSLLGFRHADRRAIWWAILAIPIQFYLAYVDWYGAFIIFIPVIMFLLLPLSLVLKGNTKGITASMGSIQWSFMLTVFGISHLAYLLSLPGPSDSVTGRSLLFFVVFLTEINDVMQFTCGKLFGRGKILPAVSPNKTWAGFWGGLVMTMAAAYCLSFLTPLSVKLTILFGALIALSGFAGDIVVSAIKRDIGVKDTGSVIPGHGGLLDRVDSLAYTAPVFFHSLYYIAY